MIAAPLNAQRWSILFTVISIVLIGIVFGINYTIDPYGTREWIVEKHFKPIVHERSEKYNYLFYQNNIDKYDCLILGSSRVMSLIPKHSDETQKCYNFGVHVANNPEKLFILQEWLKHAPLKTLYLGNELYTMHAESEPMHLNKNKFLDGSEGSYLSVQTFKISIRSLLYKLFNAPQTHFKADGSIRYPQEEQLIRSNQFNHSLRYFQELSHMTLNEDYVKRPFIYETHALAPLKQIKALSDHYHIELKVFITPTYSELHTLIASTPPLAEASQQFRSDLLRIFGEVYDFDDNHSLNRNPRNFYDPLHYRPILGQQMIRSMHSDNRLQPYGTLLRIPEQRD